MNKIESASRLVVVLLLCLTANFTFGQTCTGINPGQIFQPATASGQKIMNPSLDGWVTKFPDFVPIQSGGTSTTCGFNLNYPTAATYNCISQFEYQMFGIPEIGSGDVLNDNIGASCGITDLIPDNKGYSVYAIRKTDPTNSSLYNLIFRFRLGAFNSSVEAYSVLIDTDQRFGKVGDPFVNAATADPNWTAGNPGFELEITLINNSNGNAGGVFVYDIDGIDSCPTPLLSYSYDSHVQISQADSRTCNDPDYFFDYYVPLEEVKQKFNLNRSASNQITDSSPLRYAALTNQNAGCAMQGKISDVSGVDNSTTTYSTQSASGIYNSFLAVVTAQCGTPLTDLVQGAGGFDKDVTHAPTINGPLNVGQTVVTGTTCSPSTGVCEPGIYIRIDVYHALASPLSSPPQTPRWSQTSVDPRTTSPAGSVTEGATETTWAITLNAPLQPYDSVVATTQKSATTFADCLGNGGNTSSSSTAVVVKCLLEATLSSTNISCNGSADGSIAATISPAPFNGTGPYTYLWSNGQTTATATNLAPGTYTLVLKDIQKCQAILNPVTITQPPLLAASVSFTNVTCSGANDGTITISSPSGGYGTYEYSITGGTSWQSSGSYTGLVNKTYDVRIRDAAHPSCVVALGNTVITQPNALNASVSSTNLSCNGAHDGTITISSPSGGYGTYEYSSTGGTSWQSSGSFTGLDIGTYTVLLRDAAHPSCTKTLNGSSNIILTQPSLLSATVAATNVSCNGGHDGTITVSAPQGGYGTYEYSIVSGTWQSGGSFTNLVSGTYNVLIRDAAHPSCSVTDLDGSLNTKVNQPNVLSASLASTNVTCFGSTDGTITITAAGGSGNYQYSINGGSTWVSTGGGSFTGLGQGSYNVQLRDGLATSCLITVGNVTISQPAILNATRTSTNVSCNGASDGTITISAPSGGSGAYEYSINGGTNWQSSGSFTGLINKTYDVRIRDAAHTSCTIILGNTVITQPNPLSASVASTNVTCNAGADGTISITSPSGGYGTYEYSVNGGSNWQSSGSFSGLGFGTYVVLIRDASHTSCTKNLSVSGSITLTQPSRLSATVASTNIICNGGSDGSITITSPSGGSGTYQYSVVNGTWQSSGTFSGLALGTYAVQIRDASQASCSIVLNASTVISQPAALTASVAKTNVACNGASTGTITISNPLGGSGSYQYSNDGGSTWQSSGSFTNLAGGTYSLVIRDTNHPTCMVDLDGISNTVITQVAALSATLTTTDITCNGASNGKITISAASGGSGNFEYSINGGTSWQTSGNYTGLAGGSYNVFIRDQATPTCFKDLDAGTSTTISEPNPLGGSVATTNASSGGNDGKITISGTTGGSGSFEFSLDGTTWQASNQFTGLSAGSYQVFMRDAAQPSCVKNLGTTSIAQSASTLSATVANTNVSCNGGNDGTITVSGASGGVSGTFEYRINSGLWQAPSFTGLAAGAYDVQIRDAGNITDEKSLGIVNVSQPDPLHAAVSFTNPTCSTQNDGSITLSSPTGGYGTYEYSKDGGSTWQSVGSYTPLTAATYDVRIRDAAHASCVVDLGSTVLTSPGVLSATVTPVNVSSCYGFTNGGITVSSPSGGSGSYEYSINGGTGWQSGGSFTNLVSGTYNVWIRDAAHTACSVDLDAAINTNVSQPAALTATLTPTDVSCNGLTDGQIVLSAPANGSGNYEYSINSGTPSWQSSSTFPNLASGSYNVLIRDASNTACSVDLDGSGTTSITQPAPLTGIVVLTNVSCNGLSDGAISITSGGGYGTFDFSKDGGSNWQPTSGSFMSLAPGAYNVRVRDAAHTACVLNLDGSSGTTSITQPNALLATKSSIDVTCFGGNNGAISVSSPTGGYGTYEYSKDGGTTWSNSGDFTALTSGSYNVNIRDAAHTTCTLDLDGPSDTNIAQPALMSATVTATNVTTFGASDGTIKITLPGGGSGFYQYTIDAGSTWFSSGNFTGLSGGSYNVQIRDVANTSCVVDLDGLINTSVQQPTAPLSATLTSTNISCNGDSDGTITITSPAGGYGSYEYTVDGGSTWQPSGTFTGLASGTYNVQMRDAAYPSDVIDLDGTVNTAMNQPASLSASVTSTNVTCPGANDGAIQITSPVGGSLTYQYSINGGSTWSSSGSFVGLANGNYNLVMRDAAHPSCVVDLDGSASGTPITQPSPLSASVAVTNVTSPAANDGSITVSSPVGGYGTYEYSIDGGTTWQSSGSFTGLASGSYHVYMRDAAHNTCSVNLDGTVGSTTVAQPGALAATVTTSNVTCNAASDGQINITSPAGGYGTYEYSVNGGSSWQSSGAFTGLANGTYNVMIRDAAYPNNTLDLDGSSNSVITQPTALSATISSTNLTSTGSNDGTITVSSAAGGHGTYQYSISGGTSWQNANNFTGLADGTYSVAIRDAAYTGCVVDLDGSVNTIILPPLAVAVTSFSNINCFGRNNGSLTVNGFYGVPPYMYSSDGIAFTSSNTFNALAPGTYTLWVKDASGATASTTASVGQPSAALAALAASQQNAQCFGSGSGSITASGLNGTQPYTYSKDGGAFVISNFFNSLEAGTYTITVQDANGCIATTTAVISQPEQISASAFAVVVNGDENGSVATMASGGTPPYTYSWTGPDGFIAATDTISNLIPGDYSVVVTDANSCVSGIASYTITFKIYEGISPNGDGKNDYWRIDGIEGYPDNQVRIFDRFNNVVFETRGYSNEVNNWTGQSNHGLVRGSLPDGTYFYTVSLGDGHGRKSGYVILKRH